MVDYATYRSRVRAARISRSPEVIYNSSHGHAAVLIEELFHAGQAHIGLLCRSLNVDVYGQEAVLNAAQGFVERSGARLVVLVKDAVAADHPFLQQVVNDERYRDQVTFYDDIGQVLEGSTFNFMVADGEAYRFERDEAHPNAMACFSGRKIAQPLRDIVEDVSADISLARSTTTANMMPA